ncbi:hypothetical protein MKO06_12895 [Gramella sp. GC03-9]|uniref:Uncharacterized protein n=1 Tax=Christiangramia oceanisediminis TaxID=2920386 RepID=A0A9X2KYP3_9FLAO|nr:hypothetical protein [Gramella oceanisediminis]MCP9200810.1 hypothetical protein [Gramella oceanisediminis]
MNSVLNWNNLKPYNTNQSKSFEELCYQLMFEDHSTKGKLTSIDDSGGGDGVEFFLELPNGDIWGWQCKFFGRLDGKGRKAQIKNSLQKAYDTHGTKLKKWILCSQLTFTNDEREWFYKSLPIKIHKGRSVLPKKHEVTLDHLGDSEILNLLRKYPEVHRYFFTDKILDRDWFRDKFNLVSNSTVIKTKYLNGLHVMSEADEKVIQVLFDSRLADIIEERKKILETDKFLIEYEERISEIINNDVDEDFEEDYLKIRNFVTSNEYPSIIRSGNDILLKIQEYLKKDQKSLLESVVSKALTYKEELTNFYSNYSSFRERDIIPTFHWDTQEEEKSEPRKTKMKKYREISLGPYFTLRNYIDAYLNIFHCLEYRHLNDIHISGGASKGKTHLATNVVEYQIQEGKPAIFLFGKNFRSNKPLREQLKDLLDLPIEWSLKDFLGALNVAGRVNNTKAVLLIDGLNESIHWKSIWDTDLEMLINEINQFYPHILFITTYRSSYEKELFPDGYFYATSNNWLKKAEVEGFLGENLNEAVDRYFKHYDIKLQNQSAAMNHFSEPLYLKIFCEAKSGQIVSFQNEDLFDVFDQYLEKSNKNVVESLKLSARYNKNFSQNILRKISRILWNKSRRNAPLSCVIPKIITEEQLVVFEGEDLLIFRDWGKEEMITFTYDLLSGYLIAKFLLEGIESEVELTSFLEGDKFHNELIIRKTLHPLYHDILRCLSVLIVKKFGLTIYNQELNPKIRQYFLEALFEINTATVEANKDKALRIVVDNFKCDNTKFQIFKLFNHTEFNIDHPLNFNLLSNLLFDLSMADRDTTWTEYIRKQYDSYSSERLKNFIEKFESICKDNEPVSDRIHIAAKKIMWLLTSTNREMRDKATRAIYYYGRRFSLNFIELTEYSLAINDPYVWERTLASLYGIILAKHNDWKSKYFRENLLVKTAKRLYELIFASEAPYSMTHILARDYARRCIEVCLMHHPKSLSEDQIKEITPPYTFGGIRNWGEYEYGDKNYGYDGPIHMDFSNYTIGSLVPEGSSYSDPPEKQKVRRQIYWRIFDLGWNKEKFEKAEKNITQQGFYHARTQKPKIERYGKKYSWIAFFEIYGFREDNDLVRDEWPEFRPSQSDIDPTFPELTKNKPFIVEDFLGDRTISIHDWLKSGETPGLDSYFEMNDLNGKGKEWVCLNGFISQKDEEVRRQQFMIVRGILIKEAEYSTFVKLLKSKDMKWDRIPRVSENYYTFAGEMNTIKTATYSNFHEVQFVVGENKKLVKRGEEGYYPDTIFDEKGLNISYPKEREIIADIVEKFEILIPVAEYNWESYHSSLNQAGHHKVPSMEISSYLKLINAPQTFNLYNRRGELVTINFHFYLDYNTTQNFVYMRKDYFDKFLRDNNYKFIFLTHGERQFYSKDLGAARKFSSENDTDSYKIFKHIKEYKN